MCANGNIVSYYSQRTEAEAEANDGSFHDKGPFTPNVSVSVTLVQRNVASVVHG